MSRAKRPRMSTEPDRIAIAAYGASQPLFSALRNATDVVDKQKAALTTARDVVQQLHVKIDISDAERHEEYMQNVVDAWEAATEAYCKVFAELCNVTKADESEGRVEGKRHDEFLEMLETARKAHGVAADYARARADEEEVTTATHDDGFEDGVHVESEVQQRKRSQASTKKRKLADPEPAPDVHPHQKADQDDNQDEIVIKQKFKSEIVPTASKVQSIQTPPKRSILDESIRYSRLNPTEIIWENGQLKVPFERLQADEKKAWSAIETRQKRHGRRVKAKASRGKGTSDTREQPEARTEAESVNITGTTQNGNAGPSPPRMPSVAQDTPTPAVQYEDVSAEVEARLQAKAEKKAREKAKRTEKKRKRESGESFVNPGAARDEDAAPVELPEEKTEKSAKPAKKRAKMVSDSGVSVDGASKSEPARVVKDGKASRKQEKRKNVVEPENGDEIKVAEVKQPTKKKKRFH